METVVVLQLINGILITVVKMREKDILKRWEEGNLCYDSLLAYKKHKIITVKKLNSTVSVGKYPGQSKKED